MEEVANELNNFFSNIVQNIPNYEYCEFLGENIDNPILEAIVKWRNHPSTLAIASEYTNRENLFLNFVSKFIFEFCCRNKSAGCLEGHSGE